MNVLCGLAIAESYSTLARNEEVRVSWRKGSYIIQVLPFEELKKIA
jgi:hypothetical protein